MVIAASVTYGGQVSQESNEDCHGSVTISFLNNFFSIMDGKLERQYFHDKGIV